MEAYRRNHLASEKVRLIGTINRYNYLPPTTHTQTDSKTHTQTVRHTHTDTD